MSGLLSVLRFVPGGPGFRARAVSAMVTLAVACVILAPSLALADGPAVDDLWTEFVLAVVRTVLFLLGLPPIFACPC